MPPGGNENRGDEMYEPPGKADDDDMEGFTDDMDTKSVGMVLKALGREQADVVLRCGCEILLSIRGLGGSRAACKPERNVAS